MIEVVEPLGCPHFLRLLEVAVEGVLGDVDHVPLHVLLHHHHHHH